LGDLLAADGVEFYGGGLLFRARFAPGAEGTGRVDSLVGGTPAELWTSRAALEANPDLRGVFEEYDRAVKEYPAKLEQYQTNAPQLLAKYNTDMKRAIKENKTPPRKPGPPRPPSLPSGLYNGMIAPLQPFAMRGVIWYQGESNAGRAGQYPTLFSALIADWRRAWGEGDFPFLFVQIAPFRNMKPEIREAQLQAWRNTSNTAMVVTTDCGDANDIHPTRKQPVGARLALAARALAYGEKIEYSGPVFDRMRVAGTNVLLSFTHTGGGLVARDGELKGFTLAGADSKFVPARAVIKGDTVVVTSEQVPQPVAARYGWADVPDVNLYNRAGLPASPFRTDAPEAGLPPAR
jgi:sialate O-acetylesterase